MKVEDLLEAIEGELIRKDKSTAGKMARDIINGASEKLYRDGKVPSKSAVRELAVQMADHFHYLLVEAIEHEVKR